jgi:hypothetical protein
MQIVVMAFQQSADQMDVDGVDESGIDELLEVPAHFAHR